MLLSVIIPTYQPGEYLFHLLDKLCQQTLDASLFEVIMVLNGEPEPFRQQIARYVVEHPSHSLRLVVNDKRGVSKARNRGLDEARGEWICFIDDDDWPSPDYLEQLARQAADGTMVCANVVAIDAATGRQQPYFLTDAYRHSYGQPDGSLYTHRHFLSTAWGKLIPRAAIGSSRFNSHFSLGEDSLFMFVISRHIHRMAFTPATVVYHVRLRPGSLSRSRYPWTHRVSVLLRLTVAYLWAWGCAPWAYSFPLLLSRVAATLRKLFMSHYE